MTQVFVIGDKSVSVPLARHGCVVHTTTRGNSEELETCLSTGRTITVAIHQHVDDRALVGFRPGCPKHIDFVAESDEGTPLSRGCISMAYDVFTRIVHGGNEASVGVAPYPSHDDWRV